MYAKDLGFCGSTPALMATSGASACSPRWRREWLTLDRSPGQKLLEMVNPAPFPVMGLAVGPQHHRHRGTWGGEKQGQEQVCHVLRMSVQLGPLMGTTSMYISEMVCSSGHGPKGKVASDFAFERL